MHVTSFAARHGGANTTPLSSLETHSNIPGQERQNLQSKAGLLDQDTQAFLRFVPIFFEVAAARSVSTSTSIVLLVRVNRAR
eukprot:scaffold22055_cov163-Amphora_coffeaeformis.AAC.3